MLNKLLFLIYYSIFIFPMQQTIKDSKIGTALLTLNKKLKVRDVRELILEELATSAEMAGPESDKVDLELSLRFLNSSSVSPLQRKEALSKKLVHFIFQKTR